MPKISLHAFQNDRLKAVNNELSEKLESSELQINAIYTEYRGIVESQKVKHVQTLT